MRGILKPIKAAVEETALHSRLLRATLATEESRAFWLRADGRMPVEAQEAFDQFWFGEKSMRRVRVLLSVMQARFGRFPVALRVLHRWGNMEPETRAAICHWHVQLSDPLYRAFTGEYLVNRRSEGGREIGRRAVVSWIRERAQKRWSMSTCTELASRLLTTAHGAGLLTGRTDPRGIALARVPDDALMYLLHLLRTLSFEGTITSNPYLRSVGLEGKVLEHRLGKLPGLRYRREGDASDIEWGARDLLGWVMSGPLASEVRPTAATVREDSERTEEVQ